MGRYLKYSLVTVVLVFAYFVLRSGSPDLLPVPKNGVILAFGDSLTKGYGTVEQNSYPAVLDKLLSQKVINDGVSGETTGEGLKRFEASLNKYRPDLVLLMEGGNDILRKYDLSKTKQNLADMIELAQSRNIQVVLLAVPDKSITLSPPDFYFELADQYGLVIEKDIIGDLMTQREYKSDQIHFNQAGYSKIAHAVFSLLADKGAIVAD